MDVGNVFDPQRRRPNAPSSQTAEAWLRTSASSSSSSSASRGKVEALRRKPDLLRPSLLRFFGPRWHQEGLAGRERESGGELMMKKSPPSLRLH